VSGVMTIASTSACATQRRSDGTAPFHSLRLIIVIIIIIIITIIIIIYIFSISQVV